MLKSLLPLVKKLMTDRAIGASWLIHYQNQTKMIKLKCMLYFLPISDPSSGLNKNAIGLQNRKNG